MTSLNKAYPAPQTVWTAPEPKPRPAFTRRDWLLLLACFALAALFCHCFDMSRSLPERCWLARPGIGFTLFLLGGLAASLLYLGRRPYSRDQYLMIGAYVALALSYTLLGDPLLKRLNFLVCLGIVPLTLFSLAGLSNGSPWEGAALTQTLRRLFPNLFRFSLRPFAALSRVEVFKSRKGGALLTGLLLALPLLAVVMVLLASADAVFGSLFTDLGDWLQTLSLGRLGWVVLRTLVVGLCGFSLLYSLNQPPRPLARREASRRLPLLSWNVALLLLNAVYLLFVFIQFTVLFGGNETAAIRGGFAEYARSGFFQLVAVAVLNLALLLLARRAWPEQLSLRINGSLLLAETGVILVSALWRMTLYIRAFGLSVLRLTTLWGMAVIALAILLAAFKLWRPQTKIYRLLLAVTVASWLAFNYCGVDKLVADYNVDRYLAGSLEQVDVEYLSEELSPAAIPALQRLADSGEDPVQRAAALRAITQIRRDGKQLGWADLSLPWLINK